MTKAPTLKVKLPYWQGKYNCEIYDPNGTMLYPDENSTLTPLDLIPKGVNLVAIIQCGGLWFANGKFGCTWRLFQAVVQQKPSMKGKCLINVSSAAKSALTSGQGTSETTVIVEDDEASDCEQDEDEAHQEEESAPAPAAPTPTPAAPAPTPAPVEPTPAAAAAVVKKKVVRKKD